MNMLAQNIPIPLISGNNAFLTVSFKWSETPALLPGSDFNRTKSIAVDLSRAELRVLALIDKSDKEIAQDLFLSEHTVGSHIKSIYEKTGLKGRAKLAVWAAKQGLI